MDKCVVLSRYMKCIPYLLTSLRDGRTGKVEFVHYANRLMTILCEEGLMYVQQKPALVDSLLTPTQSQFSGLVFNADFVAVSIIRAGDSMLDCFLKVCPQASVGKILIQRDEATAKPIFFYRKIPPLEGKQVVLLDPMLATGGSAKVAIADLIAKGASEDNISFFSVVSCPEGVAAIHEAYPNVQLVTAEMDTGLNEQAYIVPGLGDYGDRYYGT